MEWWIGVVVFVALIALCRFREENMSLDDYACLLKRTEEKIGMNIIQMISIDDHYMYVIAFDKTRNIIQNYRITYDVSTNKPTHVHTLGNKPMTADEIQLYLRSRHESI
jgi:hypothetical protein